MIRHIEKLTIDRYRGLRETRLEGLSSVNLLFGANNSGKTSVLEALAVFCRPLDVREWLGVVQRRENRPLSELVLDEFTWLFSRNQDAADDLYPLMIRLLGEGQYPVREVVARCRTITGTKKADVMVEDEDETTHIEEIEVDRAGIELSVRVETDQEQLAFVEGAERPNEVRFNIWADEPIPLRTPSEVGIPVRTITPYTHRLERVQLTRLSAATQAGWKGESVELLHAIDPKIIDLEILSPEGRRAQLAVRHEILGVAPLSSFGEGIRRIIMLALSVPPIRGGTLLVDEIETAIHVSALSKVFSWLISACKQYDVQIFATTHRLEAMDALLQGTKDSEDIVGFKLNVGDAGDRAQRLSGDIMKRLREDRGIDLRWSS
jgi:hypothetical protein